MQRTGRVPRRSVLAATLWLAIGCTWIPVAAQSGDSPATSFNRPPGALIAPGDAPSLILMYTGDVIGYVDACG